MKDELLKYFDYIVQQADIARAHSPEHDVIFDNAVKKIDEITALKEKEVMEI